MKKAISFICILFLAMSSLSFSASAEEYELASKTPSTANKSLSYRFDGETRTLYIEGKGKIPAYYFGWTIEEQDRVDSFLSSPSGLKLYAKTCYEQMIDETKDTVTDAGSDKVRYLCDCLPEYYVEWTRKVHRIVIGKGITYIDHHAFAYAFPNVREVQLSSTVEIIAYEAFAGGQVKEVIVPSTVKRIAKRSFVCQNREYLNSNTWHYNATTMIIPGKNTEIVFHKKNSKMDNYCIVLKGSKAEKALQYGRDSQYKSISAPGKVSNIKLAAKSKGMKVSWTKKNITGGYQIQVATNSKFTSGKKTITVADAKTASKTIKSLKGKKKYYVRVRAYKTYKGAKFYGAWSKAKTITTKK